MKQLFAVGLLALSFSALADSATPVTPDAWIDARPDVQISVSHGPAPGTYTINAVVSDLRNGNVLANPVMETRAGAPAHAEIGSTGVKGMASVAFTVTVDPSGQTAAYSSEVRDNAEVVSSQRATLAVAR